MPWNCYRQTKIILLACTLIFSLFLPLFSLAQLKPVSGVVKDDQGNPLPNVSVMIQGGSAGTTTDENGRFHINAQKGSVLVFSSINQETFTLTVDDRNEYNVKPYAKGKCIDGRGSSRLWQAEKSKPGGCCRYGECR